MKGGLSVIGEPSGLLSRELNVGRPVVLGTVTCVVEAAIIVWSVELDFEIVLVTAINDVGVSSRISEPVPLAVASMQLSKTF